MVQIIMAGLGGMVLGFLLTAARLSWLVRKKKIIYMTAAEEIDQAEGLARMVLNDVETALEMRYASFGATPPGVKEPGERLYHISSYDLANLRGAILAKVSGSSPIVDLEPETGG